MYLKKEERLQNVLGHFQKDFEGGVSVENLGAKFGGYGSFLPTYQRSPSQSYPKNSQEVHNIDASKSPKKLHLEDGRQNLLASSSVSLSVRPQAALGRTASFCNSLEGDVTHAKESTLNCRLVNSSANPSGKRTLKVRIKVGSENLSTQKNADIYSGLGLDVSPLSSLDDSSTTSEGLCGNLQDVPDKYPTGILEMMTSLPVDLLLSPLSADLIHLTRKGKLRGKSDHIPIEKASLDSSGMLFNRSHFSRSNQKVLECKKWKSSEMDDAFLKELMCKKNSGDLDNIHVLLKKETDMDMFNCEKLVADALKLPLLSNLEHSIADPMKCTSRETVDVPVTSIHDKVKEESFSEVSVKRLHESASSQDMGGVEKLDGRLGSSGKVLENKKDVPETEKAYFSAHSGSNVCEGRNSFTGEAAGPMEHLVVKKRKSGCEVAIKQALKKSLGSKKKFKGIHSQGAQGSNVSKDQSMIVSSILLKSGQSSRANRMIYKNGQLNLQKDQGKPGDRYKAFFGDLEFEKEDEDSVSGEMTLARKLKDSQLIEKGIVGCHSTKKEKCKDKKAKKSSSGEEYLRGASSVAPLSGNGPFSDASVTAVVPLVNEDWVSCDKCKKWRLLPLGTNPKSLPDKWLCRMLTWLPGMNHCSIPEDVTTSALSALYHPVPASAPPSAPESQPNRLNNPTGISSGRSSIYASSSGQNIPNIVSQATIISKKKNNGLAYATNSTDLDAHNSQSQKKNLQTPGNSSILDGAADFPVDSCGQQYLCQSSSAFEKNEEEDRVFLDNCSDRGTNSKIRSKRESGLDCSRTSKRSKCNNVDDAASLKAGHSSSSGLSNNASGNDRHCKDARIDTKKNVASCKNSEFIVPGTSDDGFLRTSNLDNENTVKKRKGKDHGSRVLSSAGPHTQAAVNFVEETCESDYWKEMKARISTSGGKDTGQSKANVGKERKDGSTTDQYIGQSLSNTLPKCSLDAADYLRSDMGSVHPFAANSSSSKVSGSCKSKRPGQEVKGSPVESVSSSPLRFPKTDKFTSTGRILVGKVDFHDPGSLTSTSPRRFLSGEDCRNDQSGMVEKSATLTIINNITDVYDGLLGQGNQNAWGTHTSEQCQDEEGTASHSQVNGSSSKKSCKGFSSCSKDKSRSSRSDLDKNMNTVSDSSRELGHMKLYEEKIKSGRNKFDEKCASLGEAKKPFFLKKNVSEGMLRESNKGKSQLKVGGLDGSDSRLDVNKSLDKKNNHLQPEHDEKRLSKKRHSGKGNRADVNGSGRSHSAAKVQIETVVDLHCVSRTESGVKVLADDLFEKGNALKTLKQSKKAKNQNVQPICSRHPTPNKHNVRDIESPNPVRRDSSTHTANSTIKEAKDLKHLADRLKNSRSTESTGLYFQAALKFLHGASLLESGNSEGTKHNEMLHSMDIYSSTAKLCEFCALEYEKSKDMATAALAYKCVEVAYMRVVYCSHTGASRDRNALQSALQIVFPGESPSSSASDVDNFNGQATVDKAALAKVVGSPQISGSHVITTQNRSSFMRLLKFAQDTNFAMEASRKSRIAFAAASRRPGEAQDREGICFIKKALDFNFQDVDGLLHLVRVAMEAINH
ncbi:uncharacterized protein LOC111412429 isoform X2 [Olea europaea var. sylvestris]|uniref:uncharacterized protein LOC111412429 isoform X2 n=1 Tax=Olea europaea var. sylvestris TaxID=158386 RepID=UPI000C1D79EE|nr:uncharacterized protein LOC111412429 isoform X2 [Olea europaea var. sylvestris]